MFADPEKNLRQLGLREDMIVADLGAGSGFYSIEAGKMVPFGKVYAVEIIRDYVIEVKRKAKDAHLHNVECFWGNIEKLGGTKLKDGIADLVICSNVMSQVDDRERFIAEIKRILKPEGKVLFIDWTELGLGPKGDKMIKKEKMLNEFSKKGISFLRDIDAGDHHYGMILINKQS